MLKIKKIILIIVLMLYMFQPTIVLSTSYTSQYPTQDGDHVKALDAGSAYRAYFATDPAKSLTGTHNNNCWNSDLGITDKRFHIDLGSAKIIRRIYYENFHNSGTWTTRGIKDFTFWGSNTEASFLELTYGTDTGWTQLTTSQSTMDEHVALDQADPKYITVTNATAYRYYAFKFATTWAEMNYMAIRRIELQTEDGYGEAGTTIMFTFSDF